MEGKRRSLPGVFLCTGFLYACIGVVYGAGLPGEYVLTQRWRALFAPYSPMTNPALLTEENYLALRGAFASVNPGSNGFSFWEMGATYPIGMKQSAGFNWIGENDGDIIQARPDGSGELTPGASTSVSSNTNSFFTASYASMLGSAFSVGANVNFAHQTNFSNGFAGSKPLTGAGLDLGLTYKLHLQGKLGTQLFGCATQNLIAPSMSSSSPLSFGNEGEYSRDLRLTWLAHFMDNRIESGLDFNLKDFLASAKEFRGSDPGGIVRNGRRAMEYDVNYRLGFSAIRFITFWGLTGLSNQGIDHYGLAAGVNVPRVHGGRDYCLLYQYASLTNPGPISPASHSVYIRMLLGPSRQDNHAVLMALLPNELYNKAMKLYSNAQYWEALFLFGRIAVEYPDFPKSDRVHYYKAACMENLDMREVALKNYDNVRQTFIRSPLVPLANLATMRIHYRNNDHEAVYRQFLLLDNPGVPDSVTWHACYLMGETYQKQKKFQQAIDLYTRLPASHPDYVFAMYSLAVTLFETDKDRDAIQVLGALSTAETHTPAQSEIVNRARVLFGYVFYERRELSKAVTTLRMIPESSYYYEDALQGLCWTALQAQQWNDCINIARSLKRTSANPALQCDAGLIEGYAQYMLKNYRDALTVLQDADATAATLDLPSEDTQENRQKSFRAYGHEYAALADKIDGIATRVQSQTLAREADSLHNHQKTLKKSMDDHIRFLDNAKRQEFFSRNSSTIKSDIKYTLAVSQTMHHESSQFPGQEKIQNKVKEIGTQIEKLKAAMESLPSEEKLYHQNPRAFDGGVAK